MIRVIVADDHHLVRDALQRYLATASDVEIVGDARTGREAVERALETKPDVAVLDINMPEMDGITATQQIRERLPDTGVIILSAYDERRYVVDAVRAGARGYVLKTRDAEHIMRAVHLVADGHMVIDEDLVGYVAEELRAAKRRDAAVQELTARELDILKLLASGSTNREIGEALFVSIDTVKTHLEHIFQKLGTSDRTAAVAEAFRRRLID